MTRTRNARGRCRLAIAVALAWLLATSPAGASPKAAAALGAQARAAYEKGAMAQAADLFQQGFREDPVQVLLLYNAARAAHLGRALERAAGLYREFLRLAVVPAEQKVKAEGYLRELEQARPQVPVVEPPVDHPVAAAATRVETPPVTIRTQPLPLPPGPPPSSQRTWRLAGWSAAVLGAVGLLVGGAMWASGASSMVDHAEDGPSPDTQAYGSAKENRDLGQVVSGVGAAVAVTGGVVVFLTWPLDRGTDSRRESDR